MEKSSAQEVNHFQLRFSPAQSLLFMHNLYYSCTNFINMIQFFKGLISSIILQLQILQDSLVDQH